MNGSEASGGATGAPVADLLEFYRKMAEIRAFEDAIVDVYRRGEMPGLVHSSAGQEAVAVGVGAALRLDDLITSTHRAHGHVLAKGADLSMMLLEIMGKAGGLCRGKGGSMHLADLTCGVLGANGIVGGGVGIALGAAYSASLRRSGQVVASFIGDGTMNQGILFEVMNMAALWRLPLVWICENNQYGQYSHVRQVSAGELIERPRAFGIPTHSVDGMDVVETALVAAEAVDRARRGEGPTFVMADTYRFSGHHVAELNVPYRSAEEIDEWRVRDPLLVHGRRLVADGVAEQTTLDEIERAARERVTAALVFALAAPDPDQATLWEDVYE